MVVELRMSNKSQMIPKISPQYYFLSSTTIHCRSLPLSKKETDFSSRALIKIYFELQGAGEDRETNFFCSKSTSSPGTIYSSQYFYFTFYIFKYSSVQCKINKNEKSQLFVYSLFFGGGWVGWWFALVNMFLFLSFF